MRKSLITLVAASSVAVALVTAPTAAEARWRGWYPTYSYYGYPAYYSYGYPALLQLRILSACALLWTGPTLTGDRRLTYYAPSWCRD